MQMKPTYLLLTLWLLLGACSSENERLILDVPSLRGKSPSEVVGMLGEPDSTQTKLLMGRRAYIQLYDRHGIELKYHEGKLSSVIVNNTEDLPFEPGIITRFGFTMAPPTFQDSTSFFNWSDLDSVSYISISKSGMRTEDPEKVDFKVFFTME